MGRELGLKDQLHRCICHHEVKRSHMHERLGLARCWQQKATHPAHATWMLADGVDYPAPGFPGKLVEKIYWGDVRLKRGGSVHARIMGSYNAELIDDVLSELGPLSDRDVVIVNFGAWYPRFAMQVRRIVWSTWLHCKPQDRTPPPLAGLPKWFEC